MLVCPTNDDYLLITLLLQVNGFNHVLTAMFPSAAQANMVQPLQIDHIHLTKAKLKEAAKKKSEQVKAQAEQIYQTYSVKN